MAPATDVELLEESTLEEVQEFLQSIFGPIRPRLLTRELWRWKCLQPHPLWPGKRGFLRRSNGRIAAFATLHPLRLLTPQKEVAAGHIIDWGALRSVPGAGIRIYRHLQAMAGCIVGIGGSAETRQILPKIGAEVRGTARSYRRPVRPFRASQGGRAWKWPARWIRNWSYALAPLPATDDYEAVRVERFDARVAPCLPTADPALLLTVRTVDLLNYWLACPAAEMQGYWLRQRQEVIGYFLLSIVPPVAKIADLSVRPDRAEAWEGAYGLAFQKAVATGMPHVQALSSHPRVCQILDRFRFRGGSEPVLVLGPEPALPPDLPLAVSAVDYDDFYL